MLRRVLASTIVATFLGISSVRANPITPGKIFVAGDENWTAINDATTLTLAEHISTFLAPGGGAAFLYHIEDSLPWLRGASFLSGVTAAGNTITNDGGPPDAFNHDPLDFDALFVARQYANDQEVPTAALIAYVEAGGNVFVSLGSALHDDTGINEAIAWNPFLNAFGMAILPRYNDLVGDIPIVSADPLMAGIVTLYHNVGASIVLTGSDPNARLIASYPGEPDGEGLFAVYATPSVTPIPEPGTLVLVVTILAWRASHSRRAPSFRQRRRTLDAHAGALRHPDARGRGLHDQRHPGGRRDPRRGVQTAERIAVRADHAQVAADS